MKEEFISIKDFGDFKRENVIITFDEDFNIPDKKEDVDEILWTEGYLGDIRGKCEGDKVRISGNYTFEVLYRNSEGELSNVNGVLPVSQWVNISESTRSCDVSVLVKEASARIINSRKINLKALLDCEINYEEESDIQVLSDIEGEVEKRFKDVDMTSLVTKKKELIKINESIILPSNKPSVDNVLLAKANLLERSVRLVEGGGIFKGELEVAIFYSTETVREETENAGKDDVSWYISNITFEEMINLNEVKEEDIEYVISNIANSDIKVVPDEDGENRRIKVDVDICLDISVFRDEVKSVLEDAYSLDEDIKLDFEPMCFSNIKSHNAARFSLSRDLNCDDFMQFGYCDGCASVEDINYSKDGIVVNGEISLRMLGVKEKEEGPLGVITYTVPYSYTLDFTENMENAKTFINPYIERINTTLLGNNMLNVRVNIIFDTCIFEQESSNVITRIEYGTIEDSDASMVIRAIPVSMVDSLWETAKKYKTTVDNLTRSNGVTEDNFKSKKMIIIEPIRMI